MAKKYYGEYEELVKSHDWGIKNGWILSLAYDYEKKQFMIVTYGKVRLEVV